MAGKDRTGAASMFVVVAGGESDVDAEVVSKSQSLVSAPIRNQV